VESNDVEGVLKSIEADDVFKELLNKLDDDDRRLDGLLGFIPDKSELVVLIVDGDDDKRLEF
jgi:hypothetical protein